jgi:hypothetical protein
MPYSARAAQMPWMQSAWGAKLAERAAVQIQPALAQIDTIS